MSQARLLDAPLSLVDEEGTTYYTMESSGREALVSIRGRGTGVELLSRLAMRQMIKPNVRPRQHIKSYSGGF